MVLTLSARVKTRALWTITLAYMLLIFYASSLPQPAAGTPAAGLDNSVLHVPEYFVLGVLLKASLVAKRMKLENAFSYSMLAGFVYGASDEFHQSFVPGRYANLEDLTLNALGVVLGVLAMYSYSFYKQRKTELSF